MKQITSLIMMLVLAACNIQPQRVLNTTCELIKEEKTVVDNMIARKQTELAANPMNNTLETELKVLFKSLKFINKVKGYCE